MGTNIPPVTIENKYEGTTVNLDGTIANQQKEVIITSALMKIVELQQELADLQSLILRLQGVALPARFSLTENEKELLTYLQQGLSNQDISQVTRRSLQTIKNNLTRLYAKTGANSRTDLLAICRSQKLV